MTVSNVSVCPDCPDCPRNLTQHINMTSGMSLAVVYIAVLSLNSLIIFVIFGVKHRSLRWSLDYLVSFLAITDLVSTLVGVPIPIIAYMQGYWPGSCSNGAVQSTSTFNITCKLFYLFLVWGRLSTMFIITMMCIERFLAITRPFIHREIVTAGRLRKCVYGIWFVMFIYSLLPLLNIGHVKLHWNQHLDAGESKSQEMSYFFCFMDYSDLDVKKSSGLGNLIYSIVFVLFGCVSLTIVLICVFFICRILLVRRPQFNASNNKKPPSASKTYSVNSAATTEEGEQPNKKPRIVAKPSMLEKSKTFLAKRRPQIKKFEPEELQFIALMLMIAGVFYVTFLPTMVLVISNIAGHGMSENFTFWSMRFTSFVVVCNPLIYGLSNKLYRVGCLYVLKSCGGFFCCKKVPVPERLGPRKMSTVSSSRTRLTPAEKAAQDFIIAASPNKDEALAKTFVGKMKIGVEGRRLETLLESGKESGDCSPATRGHVVNFRTGTYRRETSQDLKRADYFIDFTFGEPAISFRLPSRPNLRSLRQSNSSPSVPRNSSNESLTICNGTHADTSIGNDLDKQTSLLVISSKSQETFFDVVSEAAKQARIGSSLFINHHTTASDQPPPAVDEKQPLRAKGYIRKGLREKLALKAEQARLQVQKLEKMASNPSREDENYNECENADSGIGSDTLGGTDSYESVGTGCEAEPVGNPDTDVV